MTKEAPGQLPLFDLAPYHHLPPSDLRGPEGRAETARRNAAVAWTEARGGIVVHAAYIEAKCAQGRAVLPERLNYGKLHLLDQQLDMAICYEVLGDFMRGHRWEMKEAIAFLIAGQPHVRHYITPSSVTPQNPTSRAIAEWSVSVGSRTAHGGWKDRMIVQGRHVDARFRAYEEMPERDRKLFGVVAQRVVEAYLVAEGQEQA